MQTFVTENIVYVRRTPRRTILGSYLRLISRPNQLLYRTQQWPHQRYPNFKIGKVKNRALQIAISFPPVTPPIVEGRKPSFLYVRQNASFIRRIQARTILSTWLRRVTPAPVYVLLQDAIYIAVNADLIVTQPIQYAWNAIVPAGYVISQTPAAGAVVTPFTPVYFVVSKGPQPTVTTATVPNVVGLWIQDAKNTLTNAGCEWGLPVWQYSNTVTGEIVISQSVTAGNIVALGTIVILTVSAGIPVTTLPGATVVIPLMH